MKGLLQLSTVIRLLEEEQVFEPATCEGEQSGYAYLQSPPDTPFDLALSGSPAMPAIMDVDTIINCKRTRHRLRMRPTAVWKALVLVQVVLWLSCPTPVFGAFSRPIDCTYASSNCSDCADLCTVSQFYELLPSACHPAAEVNYSRVIADTKYSTVYMYLYST